MVVSGCASGSFLAAAMISLFSAADGITIFDRGMALPLLAVVFDIVFHLSSGGEAQTDDSPGIASIKPERKIHLERFSDQAV